MYGLTPEQITVCNSQAFLGEIRKALTCTRCDPAFEMAVLIALFAKLAGVTVDCPTLEALASQYNCLPRQVQLPALIYLASQIVALVPAGGGFVFAGYYGGNPPPFSPLSPSAIATDTSAGNRQWTWLNGVWQ